MYSLNNLERNIREMARLCSFSHIEDMILESKDKGDKRAENYWRDILQIKWRS